MARATAKPIPKLTPRQVIDRIMELVAALPEQVADVPEKLRTRKHWEQILGPKSEHGPRLMEVLRELPAFTNLAPKGKGRAAWAKVFAGHHGVGQVRGLLLDWHGIATTETLKRPRVRYWRDEFGRDEKVQRVRPVESSGYLHNPHRGTTTFQRFQGDDTYPAQSWSDTHGPLEFPVAKTVRDNVKHIARTTLTYCRWPWAWLEPEKGKFDWSIIDNTLKTAHARGQTAQLRFQPYTQTRPAQPPLRAQRHPPGAAVNVPDWYWDTGAGWIEQGAFGKNEADSNDPRYLEHFGDFIRAFAARYDGHPDLESIDMAYAGFWGEAGGNATPETAGKICDIYTDSFRKTTILGMLGTDGTTHAVRQGHNIGWRADCFGDLKRPEVKEVPPDRCWNHSFDAYVQTVHRSGMKDRWKTAPVTMETCWTVAGWQMMGFDIDRIIDFGYSYHMSVFMPKNVWFPERALEKLIPFDRKIGYRFVIRQMLFPIEAQRGKPMHVECYLENVGIAPIYRPYRLALRFQQGKTTKVVPFKEDIRGWLPGAHFLEEELVLPPGFEKGEVKVALGIVDDADTPRVWFAIDRPTDAGWHPLTSVDAV
jgi:hypothetical protein